MESPKPPSLAEQAGIVEFSAEVAAARSKRPSWDDIHKEFPQAEIATRPDGQVECRVRHEDDGSKRKMLDLMRPWREAETDVGSKLNAEMEKRMVKVQTTSGPREAHESSAEHLDRTSGVRGLTFGYSRRYSEADYWRNRG